MALVLNTMFRGYSWLFDEMADPRAKDFVLASSALQPLCIIALYFWFVFKAGPKFMENRQPFRLEKVLMLYNLGQILLNMWMAYHGTLEMLRLNWHCSPVDYSSTPHNMFVYKVMHCYFLSKVIDLFDTVFFVLKKNYHQISFLHVHHHALMVVASWIGIKFLAGGHSIYIGAVNSFIHVVMYFYYFLTSVIPEYKQKLWWKKHLTQLQMAQFLLLGIIFGKPLLQPECTYPKLASYVFVPQNIVMFLLFADFYRKRYMITEKKDA